MMVTRKPFDALSDFQSRSVGAYLESWQGYWTFLADVARDPRSVSVAYGKLADVSLKNYKSVLDASVALTNSIFNRASNGAASEPAPAASVEPPPKPVRELVFEETLGEFPPRHFLVANKTEQPLNVAFEASEFVSDDMRKIRVPVDVQPAAFVLPPGAEKVVECRIPFSASFAKGCDYRAMLRAAGLPEMSVILTARRALH